MDDAPRSISPLRQSGELIVRLGPQLLLVLILAVGAYLRFAGLNWDEGTHLHPDERFLTMVENSIEPVSSWSEFFDTERSTLNPNNAGHSFFVYGTLPIFIVRYLGQWLDATGYGEVHLVGRAVSATFDLVTILLVYLIGARLYRRRVGIVAAAFSALTVLLIQHAHFFVVDPFLTTFMVAGFYFAVRIQQEGDLSSYALFGLFLGMAAATKVNAAPLAGLAVIAAILRLVSAQEDRGQEYRSGIIGLVVAAGVSLIAFRILQPYAFRGPGLLGLLPNPRWLETLGEIRLQSSGAVDFPPALQWADRIPIWFSLKNMVLWGMGFPLGAAAWLSWGWAAYRVVKGVQWTKHLMITLWPFAFFVWQSSGFTQAMRYQLPIYPLMTVLAAWGLWQLYDRAGSLSGPSQRALRAGSLALMGFVILSTGSYAFSFLRVYTNETTRVAASRWIYAKVPAAVNVIIQGNQGEVLEPLAVPTEFLIKEGNSQTIQFRAQQEGAALAVTIPHARPLAGQGDEFRLAAELFEVSDTHQLLGRGEFSGKMSNESEGQLLIPLKEAPLIHAGLTYALGFHFEGGPALRMDGEPALVLESADGEKLQGIPLPQEQLVLGSAEPITLTWDSRHSGLASGIRMAQTVPLGYPPFTLSVRLLEATSGATLMQGSLAITDATDLNAPTNLRFEEPTAIEEGVTYQLTLEVAHGAGLAMRGSTIVIETSWDDPLPQRLDGYDIGGRYPSRNLEFYWPDDEDSDQDGELDKVDRIVNSLDDGDYLFISSNRQYGTIARVPVRYPLTTAFYRELLSCPPPRAVWRCADGAQPGETENEIGYKLVQVFETNPAFLGLEVSDQGAEESFTVYDHPQVLIFKKTDDFNAADLRARLEAISLAGLDKAVPRDLRAGDVRHTDLRLPAERWEQAVVSGTWKELFPTSSPLNQSHPLTIIAWWLTIAMLGLMAWPLVRRAFPGLALGGYGIARIMGLLLFAWATWVVGSLGIPMTRVGVWITALALVLIAATFAWRDREVILEDVRQRRRELVIIELLALAFFLLDLAIRIGNPDLWHPSKGGEKPMDLSYLNAVLKSPTFPPFDPWFAGGYINYYYFGFLIVGMPMKLLGIETGLGYNLALPTLMSLLALAGYTAASNLVMRPGEKFPGRRARWAGFAAAISLVLLGNLGTARMLWEALQQAGGGVVAAALPQAVLNALRGVIAVLFEGRSLPIALDAWYWEPSRAIPPGPGEPGPITEFPFFTFLYADLHAHLISLPLTVTALAWGISRLRAAATSVKVSRASMVLSLALGALVVGSLRPTNTWDFPVYMILLSLAILASPFVGRDQPNVASVARGVLSLAAFVGLAFLLYLPFSRWYGQGYNAASLWQGAKTPLDAYFTVYGLFLFVLGSWLLWETWQWMAMTPLSALARVRRWIPYLAGVIVALGLSVLVITLIGYSITLVVVPVIVWAGLLLLRRNQAVGKRATLFLLGTGLALTLVVEVVVLQGDIGRMNTVFKFYLQVWTLFCVAGGAAFAWLATEQRSWSITIRGLWQIGLAFLVFGAALYPLTATPAKIRDRMSLFAPQGLDGMAFMKTAIRSELGKTFELDEDYRAIQWMQENVVGSPVIVEANIPEYRWGSRYTIYTGLPGVLGWNWHQRQQRVAAGSEEVSRRAEEISRFYMTESISEARGFLEEYGVRYVVVGHLERIYYGTLEPCFPTGNGPGGVTCDMASRPIGVEQPALAIDGCQAINPERPEDGLSCPVSGLEKFERMRLQGDLGLAFEAGSTRIYEVLIP
jgi:YYY domain-containing protein